MSQEVWAEGSQSADKGVCANLLSSFNHGAKCGSGGARGEVPRSRLLRFRRFFSFETWSKDQSEGFLVVAVTLVVLDVLVSRGFYDPFKS